MVLLIEHANAYACAVDGSQSYQPLIAEVADAFNKAGSGVLGASYPSLPQLKAGYPNYSMVPGSAPCVILKAIGYVESSWHQATWSVARGGTGATLVSGGCGYGIMQITSGMQTPGALPVDVQQQIAQDYVYDIAYGAKMLADKWNYAPQYRPSMGNADPAIVEDWYYTVWSYNTWGWRNNPNNPDYPSVRPSFDGSQSRTNYPYQELVWGYAANPPTSAGSPLWSAVPLTLPDRAAIGTTPGWIDTPQPSHQSPCASPRLNVKPAQLQFLAAPGAKSTLQPLQITIDGTSSPSWTATADQSWIRLTSSSGSTSAATIWVMIDATNLAPGSYTGNIVIDAPGAAGTPQTIPVDVRVAPLSRTFFPYIQKGT